MVGTGGSGGGKYVYFDRSDQRAFWGSNGVLLGAALCLLGPAVCVVAGVIIAVANAYLDRWGLCPTSSPYLRVRIVGFTVLGCYNRFHGSRLLQQEVR